MNRRIPMSPTSTPEGLPRQRETQLIAAAARVFRTGFPNTDRSGCPTQEALQSVSRKTRGSVESEAVLEHLTCCSPCFAEYERLLRRDRLSKNLKILALCASLLITVGLAVWFYAFSGKQGLRPPRAHNRSEAARRRRPLRLSLRWRSLISGTGLRFEVSRDNRPTGLLSHRYQRGAWTFRYIYRSAAKRANTRFRSFAKRRPRLWL